jgi:hypothetical protein
MDRQHFPMMFANTAEVGRAARGYRYALARSAASHL